MLEREVPKKSNRFKYTKEQLIRAAARSGSLKEMAAELHCSFNTLTHHINAAEYRRLKALAEPTEIVVEIRKRPFDYTDEQLKDAAKKSKSIKEMALVLNCSYHTLLRKVNTIRFENLKNSEEQNNSALLAFHGIFAVKSPQEEPVNKMSIGFINN